MAISNLNSLLANKEIYPLIERPDELRYYLSPEEYNLILNTLQQLIDDYNNRIDGISSDVLQSIIKSGDLTQATDNNIFSALKTLQEIQAIVAQANSSFLSKVNPDRAAGKITFGDGLEVGNYQPDLKGGKITNTGEAELKSLKIRDWLEVPELRYNRIEVLFGDSWRAPGGGIIQHVDPESKIITLKLEDGEIGAVSLNDLCFGIIHSLDPAENSVVDSDNGKGTRYIKGFASVYFKVEEILSNNGTNQVFRYSLRPISADYTRQIHPKEFMHFVAFGNTSNIDRQNSAYETRTYERFLTGVNTWEYTQMNIAAQFGDLSNLIEFGYNMTGYSIFLNNVYFTGNIVQIKAPKIINGYWHTWNGSEWINTGVRATEAGTSPIHVHLTNSNVTVYEDDLDNLTLTITELHIYEGQSELTFKPLGELNEGQYKVITQGTNVTPGDLVLDNIHVKTNKATNLVDSPAQIKFIVNGIRLNGETFEVSIVQNINLLPRADSESEEYVFATTQTPNPPYPPIEDLPAIQDDDYIPPGWTDNGTGLTDVYIYEWRAKRKKEDNLWTKFSSPRIVGRWGKDGQDGTDYEYIFKRTVDNTPPSPSPKLLGPIQLPDYVPSAAVDGPGYDGWTDDMVGPTVDLPYEWVCKRVKENEIWSEFSNPKRWLKYGKDGGSTESIYKTTSEFIAPSSPDNGVANQLDNFIPAGWTKNPTGVGLGERYEWYAERYKIDEVWTAFSPVALHNVFGEDGSDIEFIFCLTQTDVAPLLIYTEPDKNGLNIQDDEYLPNDDETGNGWEDDPVDISKDWPYLWVAKRNKDDNLWGLFSSPVKWSVHGKDGSQFEYVYKLTSTDNPPQLISTDDQNEYQEPDYLPKDQYGVEWEDNPVSVSEELPYLWEAVRRTIDGVWQPFSNPYIYTRWAKDGQDGAFTEFWGDYDPNTIYYGSSKKVIAVKHNGVYWKTVRNAGEFSGIAPQSPPPSQYDGIYPWEPFGTSYESVATKLILAEEGNIAKFIFLNEALTSQSGEINGVAINMNPLNNSDFIPNIILNGSNGEAHFSAGRVAFHTDGSGHVADENFSWDANGNITANNITLNGEINTRIGTLGKWEITADGLYTAKSSFNNIRGGSIIIDENEDTFLRINSGVNLSGPRITKAMIQVSVGVTDTGWDSAGIAIRNAGGSSALSIQATTNYAIESTGGHYFQQVNGSNWWSPGILFVLTVRPKSKSVIDKWHITNLWGVGVSPPFGLGGSTSNSGTLTITHNIGHTEYTVFVTSQAKDGSATVSSKSTSNVSINYNNHNADEVLQVLFIGRPPQKGSWSLLP